MENGQHDGDGSAAIENYGKFMECGDMCVGRSAEHAIMGNEMR